VIDGETLSADEVELRATRHESFALAEDGGWAVALDLALDDELRSEGLARELTRALNEARKEIGLEISDRVRIAVSSDDQALLAALDEHRKRIANEVLALELTTVDSPAGPRSVQIGDATLHVAITVTTNGR
jgi:isoleucyl-tRNA synthetase